MGFVPLLLVRQEAALAHVSFIDLPDQKTAIRELMAGQVDAIALPMDEWVRMASHQVLKVVAAINLATGQSALVSRPDITHIQEIQGKRVGLMGDAGSVLLLSAALQKAGLTDRNAVERILLPQGFFEHPPSEPGLLDNLDVLAVREPYLAQCLAEGWRTLLDSRQIPGWLADLVVVRQEALDRHGEAVRDLLRQLSVTMDTLVLDPDNAIGRVAPVLGMEPEVLTPLLEDIDWAGAQANRRLFEGSCGALCQSAQKVAEILTQEGFLQEPPAMPDLFDGRFLATPPP